VLELANVAAVPASVDAPDDPAEPADADCRRRPLRPDSLLRRRCPWKTILQRAPGAERALAISSLRFSTIIYRSSTNKNYKDRKKEMQQELDEKNAPANEIFPFLCESYTLAPPKARQRHF